MIYFNIPNNNLKERSYIIDILFGEFLGLDYEIKISEKDYEIVLENRNKLIIEDHFFSKYLSDLEYLKIENIPKKVEFSKNKFIVESNLPILYGSDKLEIKSKEFETIICGTDVFAASFFMLTRWEEHVNKVRDKHDRFPAYESFAFKEGILDRPVVNEYVEMVWNMLVHLGIKQQRKKRRYKLHLTHDVDFILRYKSFGSSFQEIGGDLLKRYNLKLALNNLSNYIKTILGVMKDPFDTFDYLMDISEEAGTKSYFFFMGKGTSNFDNGYISSDKFVINLIKKIKKRNHFIGLHPSYNAYNNIVQFKSEKNELENNLKTDMFFGREHYLRFSIPNTWQVWEDNNMEWDSTLGYADKEGFRAGVCYEYSVFNILTRKMLNLKEKPLIVMEGSFSTYQPDIDATEMEEKIKNLMSKVEKYQGDFVFLWHNSSFNTDIWKKYRHIYKNVINQ